MYMKVSGLINHSCLSIHGFLILKLLSWWKRLLVFVLGVFQICIGALIISATSVAAAGFGAFMIQSGFKDCMNALFRPELLNDLSKYYT